MAALIGIRGQRINNHFYNTSGTITSGSSPQLILPRALARTSLVVQNISSAAMYITFGAPPATATLGTGNYANQVASIAVGNAGFGYSIAPNVLIYGGANYNRNDYPTYALSGDPEYPSPSNQATAHCVMTGTAPNMTISSIAIDNPGSGYAYPPFVLLVNNALDPYGCSIPSATNGILLAASGGSYTSNGTVCTTDQCAIFCGTSTSAFTCMYTL